MKIINKIIGGALFVFFIGMGNTSMAQMIGNSFTASVGYTNQTINHSDKNTMISIGYSQVIPFYNWCSVLVDYGFEPANNNRKGGTSLGAELQHNLIGGLKEGGFSFGLSLGVRYQYDRIFFTDNPAIKSHSLGPVARLRVSQLFIESGYLWGVNDVDLQANSKGTMNAFILKVGGYIPANNNGISRKLKELSKKENF